jgi:hypothetical protein
MTEKQAFKIVCKHGRYMPKNPPQSRYSLRYPPTSLKALFASDTRELLEKLMKRNP